MHNLQDGVRVTGNSGPKIGGLLGGGASHGRALHFTLVVDNHTSVILEIDESTLLASPSLSLANNNSGVDLLSQLGLSFLAGSHNQVTNASGRQLIQATLHTVY